MHTKTFKWVVGAAIVMFIFTGTAMADGKRGPRHGGKQNHHSGYAKQHGPQFDHRGPGREFGRYQHRPHHSRPYFKHRHHYRPAPRYYHRPYRPVRPYDYGYRPHYRHTDAFYGFSFSFMDPNFAFGISTGQRW